MHVTLAIALMLLAISSRATFAQAPAPAPAPAAPTGPWIVTASGGLALTSGNKDTYTVNANYDVTYDPKTRNVVKSEGLWIRGKSDGELTASRLGLNLRDEFALGTRAFVFAQNQYLRDEFKSIDYLVAPVGGLGYKLFDSMATKLAVDAGVGAVWEKNPGVEVSTSGAVTASQKLTQTLTATTTLTQGVSALWKTKDWDDALYAFTVGVAATISARTQLKVEVLDVYKNKPLPGIQKNDVAVIMAIVYKTGM
jgi:putative salt-induced outer membrane protein YdiY